MSSGRKLFLVFAGSLALLTILALVFAPVGDVEAEVLAAPTPVSVARSGSAAEVVTIFEAVSLTEDSTSSCVPVGNYDKADIYVNLDIDATNVNTTTLTLKHANGLDDTAASGVSIVSAAASDAVSMVQAQVFGAYLCVTADLTDASTGTVGLTVNALLK